MKVKTWKFELMYWLTELFLMIGGMLLVRNCNGSWLIWVIGTIVTFIGVGMLFLYLKLYTDTSMFKCDFIVINKVEEFYDD